MFTAIRKRWKAALPDFFIKVRKAAITVGTSATAVWVANNTMGLQLDPIILDVCKYVIATAAGMGITAQLTQKDSSQNQ